MSEAASASATWDADFLIKLALPNPWSCKFMGLHMKMNIMRGIGCAWRETEGENPGHDRHSRGFLYPLWLLLKLFNNKIMFIILLLMDCSQRCRDGRLHFAGDFLLPCMGACVRILFAWIV